MIEDKKIGGFVMHNKLNKINKEIKTHCKNCGERFKSTIKNGTRKHTDKLIYIGTNDRPLKQGFMDRLIGYQPEANDDIYTECILIESICPNCSYIDEIGVFDTNKKIIERDKNPYYNGGLC